MRSHLLLACLIILITGCATQPPPPKSLSSIQPANWPEKKFEIEQIKSWSIEGKIGIKQPDSSDSAIINRWQQVEDQFIIDLSSTILGIGSTQIIGSRQALQITNNNGETIASDNPELLLYQQTGWVLPFELLPYWVKGIPAPINTSALEFSQTGDLTHFSQAGWNIFLSKFKTVNKHRLPGKIKLTKDDVRIILVVNEWLLDS